MLAHTPRALPPLSAMLFDLANPTPAQVGRALGVSPRTVRRWIAQDWAPRPAMLALFWLTRWGRSQVDCAAVNEASAARGMAEALSAQNKALQRQIEAMQGLDLGSANAPLFTCAS